MQHKNIRLTETWTWSCILAFFHKNRGVPNFRPSMLSRIRFSFPVPHPVPKFPHFPGCSQIPYPVNLYQIPGIPFQTLGNKSTFICHLFDTRIAVIDLKSTLRNLTWENVGSILAQKVANDNRPLQLAIHVTQNHRAGEQKSHRDKSNKRHT